MSSLGIEPTTFCAANAMLYHWAVWYMDTFFWHFLLNEGPSPSTQPCQDRTACISSKHIISSQFHHPVRHINHNSFKNSQKPWSYDWWSADFLRPHCLNLPGPADLLYSTSRRSGLFFWNMLHNSLHLFCPDLTIAMLSWQVFQPVLSNLNN